MMLEKTDGSSPARWRTFCAVELPRELKERLLEHVAKLRALVPEAKASWSRDTNIHLTLKFLGEIPKASVADLGTAVTNAGNGIPPFRILISDAGVFPHRRDPRVLWIGVLDPEAQLENLHSRLENECEQKGFPRESRRFHPHLTLARLRSQHRARELARAHEELKFDAEEVTVSEVLIIRSDLNSSGSKYTTISKHHLKG